MLKSANGGRVSFKMQVYKNKPWYHDFSKLGLQTNFTTNLPLWVRVQNRVLSSLGKDTRGLNLRGDNYVKNQKDKEKRLLPLLREVFELYKSKEVSFLELFCADGYYSFWIKKSFNSTKMVGVDISGEDIRRCNLMKKILNCNEIEFRQGNVLELSEKETFDIVLNAGGLYHLRDPLRFIKLSYSLTNRFMVLQTVVTLETESEDYFVSPAPGSDYGCRFTNAWIINRLKDVGWNILKKERDVLSGNEKLCDKGSSYFLLEKP